MSLNHIEGQLFTFDIVGQGFVLSNRVKVYGEGPNGYEDSHFRQYMYIRFRSDGTYEMSTTNMGGKKMTSKVSVDTFDSRTGEKEHYGPFGDDTADTDMEKSSQDPEVMRYRNRKIFKGFPYAPIE